MWIYVTHMTGLRYSRCQDKIQDLVKTFKMPRQNPRSCQDIQDPRYYQDSQDSRSCKDI